MKLKDLVKKLQKKPNQEADVDFLVYETATDNIVCAHMNGPRTTALMKVFAEPADEPA